MSRLLSGWRLPPCRSTSVGASLSGGCSPPLPPLPPTLVPVADQRDGLGLFDAAMSNAGASKRTRRALRDRLWLVQDSSPGVRVSAARLNQLFSHAYAGIDSSPPPSAHEHSSTGREHMEEYFQHFQPRGYSIAGAELREETTCRLLALLQLSPSDVFVDLGSSTGRLALAAALMSPARVLGVELSPSRHKQSVLAASQLADPELSSRLSFQQGDLLEAVCALI